MARRRKCGHVTRGPQDAARSTPGQTTPVRSHYEERIAADNDQGRERLARYCTRPAFALARIELLPDGRIVYLLKTPRRGRTHRVMCAMEFMARLAALIPLPKIPLVRYQGVFAPRSSLRSPVTPKPPARAAKPEPCPGHVPRPGAPASPAPAPALPASPALASAGAATPHTWSSSASRSSRLGAWWNRCRRSVDSEA
ncbi:transposase [Sorangium sp. So ce726]|uniref:transposase n=1 Tax=Sorangium sp. So ce726 TaxID=3133319 RepID=UPI003F616785